VLETSRKIFQCANKSEINKQTNKQKIVSVCARAQYSAFCTLHIHTQKKIINKKTIHKQIQKCCCSSLQPSGFCRTMAECDNSAVISENSPDMDSNELMDTSWVSSSSRKRGPKPALRYDKKIMKSTDSLVDVSNRFTGLTDEEEEGVLTPSTKVVPTPPQGQPSASHYHRRKIRLLLSNQNGFECPL
jgi:hypothetical protein